MKKDHVGERRVGLGGGISTPYPSPSSEAATKVARGNQRVNTKPEVAVRSALHKRGLRFRVDMGIRAGRLLVHPDVVFTRSRVALFVDGCFWHGCTLHGTTPRSNVEYWGPKLVANKARDRKVDEQLKVHGWRVIRCWEHDDPDDVAERVRHEIRQCEAGGA